MDFITQLTIAVSIISLIASCVAITFTRTMWKMTIAEIDNIVKELDDE